MTSCLPYRPSGSSAGSTSSCAGGHRAGQPGRGRHLGVTYAVYLRAPYGIRGAWLPALLRAGVAVCWFAIQTYFGALQILITTRGIRTLENLAVPALLLSAWVVYLLGSQRGWGAVGSFPITTPIPFWAAVTANLSVATGTVCWASSPD